LFQPPIEYDKTL